MEILSNLLQAIDIQQKRQDDDFREMMSKPLKEQVDKGHTLVNLFITGINFFEDQPNNYCPQIGSNQRFVNRIYIHCTNNCSKFREGTPVVLINGPYKLHMDIESDGIDDFILHSNDYDVKYNFMNFINYPMENWMINSVNLSITANLLRSTWQRSE
jgi:hypothetical protein